MILRYIYLLLTLVILIGCNQSDSNNSASSVENADNKESKSIMDDSTSAVEVEPERIGKVVARVNGQPIYEDDITLEDLEFFITEEILYQDAINNDYEKYDKNKVREYERNLIISSKKQKILENAGPTKVVSPEDVKNYYESNKDQYRNVIIHEISFPQRSLGSEIKNKVQSGEELQAIVNNYPNIPITVNDIAYNRELAQHFTVIEVGSVSDVIKKSDGTYSVLKIADVREIPQSAAGRSIKHLLTAQQRRQILNNYAQKVAEENNMTIEIIEQNNKQ